MVKGTNRLVLVILCISNFLCMLDTTIMTIVIPKIQSGLNASLDQVLWAVNLYAIIFASVTLLVARIAEIYGKKPVFIIWTNFIFNWINRKWMRTESWLSIWKSDHSKFRCNLYSSAGNDYWNGNRCATGSK